MNSSQHSQIESYLSGQMSHEEVSNFESLLEVSPELQQQLQFQSEIIEGIGSFRKTELKARLEVLNPTPAWYTVAHLSPVGQFIGGGIITSLIGVGGFMAFGSEGDVLPSESIVIDAPVKKEIVWDLPEMNPPKVEQIEQLIEEVDVEAQPKVTTTKETQVMGFNPIVSVPNAGDVEAEKEFQSEELPAPSEVENRESVNAIDVEIIESRASKVKYRYYEGKLFLYGKFKDEPYQILEINSSTGRRVYLYHKSVFYGIHQSDRPLELSAVTDDKLIRELSILRKAK